MTIKKIRLNPPPPHTNTDLMLPIMIITILYYNMFFFTNYINYYIYIYILKLIFHNRNVSDFSLTQYQSIFS